jgi:hypothetical protein
MSDLSKVELGGLSAMREKFEADLAEHRRGAGESRTATVAHHRVDEALKDAEILAVQEIQQRRYEAITGTLTPEGMTAGRAALIHEAIDRPASHGYAEVISPTRRRSGGRSGMS